ncbi:hypothetical protein CBL_04855 [Carabus blaptoides fortunei]
MYFVAGCCAIGGGRDHDARDILHHYLLCDRVIALHTITNELDPYSPSAAAMTLHALLAVLFDTRTSTCVGTEGRFLCLTQLIASPHSRRTRCRRRQIFYYLT